MHCGVCQQVIITAKFSSTGYIHQSSSDDAACCYYPEPENLEQEQKRVFGACGGKCGEAPCIAWNERNNRRLEHIKNRAVIG